MAAVRAIVDTLTQAIEAKEQDGDLRKASAETTSDPIPMAQHTAGDSAFETMKARKGVEFHKLHELWDDSTGAPTPREWLRLSSDMRSTARDQHATRRPQGRTCWTRGALI